MKDLERRVKDLEARVLSLENFPVEDEGVAKKNKKQSIREFLADRDLEGDTKKTLAISYFFELVENNGFFNTDDLKSSFKKAKYTIPTNINDRINMNLKQGFIMENDEKKDGKKTWVLTDTGEKEVETNLGKKNE